MHALEKTLDLRMDDAEEAVREALSGEGFGVLTRIDVSATLRDTLGIERPALTILGACNPVLANRSMDLDPSMALLLPCNVVLEDAGPGRTRVAIVDPRDMVAMAGTGADIPAGRSLAALGQEAADKLRAVVDRLGD